MELIKISPGSPQIDEFKRIPQELFPSNYPLHFESISINQEFLEHCYILKNENHSIGGIALFNNPRHRLNGEKACCVGYFHCTDNKEATKILFEAVKKDAQLLGAKYIIGPLNGTTWESYRFRTTESPPSFFLESAHPSYYNDLFISSGFYEIKTYYSFLIHPLQPMSSRVLKKEQEFLNLGITFRYINPDKYAEDLRKIYNLSLKCFKNNFLYTPYSWQSFVNKYRHLYSIANPKMTLIAEDNNEIVGFVFMIEDILCTEEKRFIFKTYAAHPDWKYAGLGAVISQRLTQTLISQNYTSSIHAFVIEGSSSFNASSKNAQIYRTYKLYALNLKSE